MATRQATSLRGLPANYPMLPGRSYQLAEPTKGAKMQYHGQAGSVRHRILSSAGWLTLACSQDSMRQHTRTCHSRGSVSPLDASVRDKLMACATGHMMLIRIVLTSLQQKNLLRSPVGACMADARSRSRSNSLTSKSPGLPSPLQTQ